MQKLIDKLKFVEDELFKDEKYYRGPVMGSIVDVRRELEQVLQQTPVMRGGTPEPLALLEQERIRLHEARPQNTWDDGAHAHHLNMLRVTSAIQLIKELTDKANGAYDCQLCVRAGI